MFQPADCSDSMSKASNDMTPDRLDRVWKILISMAKLHTYLDKKKNFIIHWNDFLSRMNDVHITQLANFKNAFHVLQSLQAEWRKLANGEDEIDIDSILQSHDGVTPLLANSECRTPDSYTQFSSCCDEQFALAFYQRGFNGAYSNGWIKDNYKVEKYKDFISGYITDDMQEKLFKKHHNPTKFFGYTEKEGKYFQRLVSQLNKDLTRRENVEKERNAQVSQKENSERRNEFNFFIDAGLTEEAEKNHKDLYKEWEKTQQAGGAVGFTPMEQDPSSSIEKQQMKAAIAASLAQQNENENEEKEKQFAILISSGNKQAAKENFYDLWEKYHEAHINAQKHGVNDGASTSSDNASVFQDDESVRRKVPKQRRRTDGSNPSSDMDCTTSSSPVSDDAQVAARNDLQPGQEIIGRVDCTPEQLKKWMQNGVLQDVIDSSGASPTVPQMDEQMDCQSQSEDEQKKASEWRELSAEIDELREKIAVHTTCRSVDIDKLKFLDEKQLAQSKETFKQEAEKFKLKIKYLKQDLIEKLNAGIELCDWFIDNKRPKLTILESQNTRENTTENAKIVSNINDANECIAQCENYKRKYQHEKDNLLKEIGESATVTHEDNLMNEYSRNHQHTPARQANILEDARIIPALQLCESDIIEQEQRIQQMPEEWQEKWKRFNDAISKITSSIRALKNMKENAKSRLDQEKYQDKMDKKMKEFDALVSERKNLQLQLDCSYPKHEDVKGVAMEL